MTPENLNRDLDRVQELLQEFDITDTDILKHTLEDHERWRNDVVEMDVKLQGVTQDLAILICLDAMLLHEADPSDFMASFPAVRALEDLKTELKDWKRSFDLYHKASMSLMHAYKKAHPDFPENIWPSASTVNEWAAKEIAKHMS